MLSKDKRKSNKLTKITGWSDIERLDIELNKLLTGADALQAKAVRRYIREFSARETKGIENIMIDEELSLTRRFIADLTERYE